MTACMGAAEMFELCALLAPKRIKRARKPSGPKVGPGKAVTVSGHSFTVTGRDTRYTNAWFIARPGETVPFTSVSRDMIVVA
jgi:hypothetical protein